MGDLEGVAWERQVGVPDREPSGRAVEVSTFTDRVVAERSVAENLAGNAGAIAGWLWGVRPLASFVWDHRAVTGRHVPKWAASSADTVDVTGSRVVLRRDPTAAEGHRIHIARPVPLRSVEGLDPVAPEWREIAALFGGYLHQDLVEDHGSPGDAVAAFCGEWPEIDVVATTDQADRLLRRYPTEDDLRAATEALGLQYHPPSAGQTYRAWLADLPHLLWRALPVNPPPRTAPQAGPGPSEPA